MVAWNVLRKKLNFDWFFAVYDIRLSIMLLHIGLFKKRNLIDKLISLSSEFLLFKVIKYGLCLNWAQFQEQNNVLFFCFSQFPSS